MPGSLYITLSQNDPPQCVWYLGPPSTSVHLLGSKELTPMFLHKSGAKIDLGPSSASVHYHQSKGHWSYFYKNQMSTYGAHTESLKITESK